MANMSYCRFRNTLNALQDCFDNMDDSDLSQEEKRAKDRLVKLCSDVHADYGEDEE